MSEYYLFLIIFNFNLMLFFSISAQLAVGLAVLDSYCRFLLFIWFYALTYALACTLDHALLIIIFTWFADCCIKWSIFMKKLSA